MKRVNFNNQKTRMSVVSRVVLFAVLMFSSGDVLGGTDPQSKTAKTSTEVVQEKAETSEKAAKIYKDLPLHYAVWKKDKKLLLEAIEEHGTDDINEKASNGRTPLSIAAIKGSVDIAKILIKNGAKIDLKSGKGTPPLVNAVFNNRLSMVKYLTEEGANVTEVDASGFNALMTAANSGYLDIVKYLLKNDDVVEDIDRQSKMGNTALIVAVNKKNANIMELLIKAGADANIKNKKGKTALSIAKGLKKQELIDILENAKDTDSANSRKRKRAEVDEDSDETAISSDSKDEDLKKAKEKKKSKGKKSNSKKKKKNKKK